MTWNLSNPKKAAALEAEFMSLGIDYTQPGFCDSNEFLRVEQDNPRILELYAAYIEARSYSDEYLTDARNKIEVVANAVSAAVEADGRLGACIDSSMIIGRMLDKLGVWNYVSKACMTIRYPDGSALKPSYFFGIDTGNFSAPHAIVVAPPFYVIDVTAKYQQYTANQTDYIPAKVLVDDFHEGAWGYEDLASPAIRNLAAMQRMSLQEYVQHRHGNMLEVSRLLPARVAPSMTADHATITYINVAIGACIELLEGITGYQPCGRSALKIFEEDVLTKL